MKKSILGLILATLASGCVIEAAEPAKEDPMILNEKNLANLGKSFTFQNRVANAGEIIVTKRQPIIQLANDKVGDPRSITLALESSIIGVDPASPTDQTTLQGILRFSAGSSSFGMPQEAGAATPPFAVFTDDTEYDTEIYFDIGRGTKLVIPAANNITLDVVVNSVARAGYAAGNTTSPLYRINVGFSYEPTDGNTSVTYTDLIRTVAPGDFILYTRPLFAKSFRLLSGFGTGLTGGSVTIDQYAANVSRLTVNEYALPATAKAGFPDIQWVEGADFAIVGWGGTGLGPNGDLTMVHTLDF